MTINERLEELTVETARRGLNVARPHMPDPYAAALVYAEALGVKYAPTVWLLDEDLGDILANRFSEDDIIIEPPS